MEEPEAHDERVRTSTGLSNMRARLPQGDTWHWDARTGRSWSDSSTVADETAFEAILAERADGPDVCRQLLHPDPHDAEDAFQATFLGPGPQGGLDPGRGTRSGPGCHTVAGRIAARARANRRRSEVREVSSGTLPEQPARMSWSDSKFLAVIHEELVRLPERLRSPIVLCYLEGSTHEPAARRLHVPSGPWPQPFGPARRHFAKRLVRVGLSLSAGASPPCWIELEGIGPK